ncbi:hypothetical protein [Lysinibacillus piscis]|uniref:Lipoprotein n=1 Tax=Lysinibacillus piscis TaxID=2518931 RepID=A0ABQ5NF46_9BACI|nr:hypothetical protein [Lysinibacillus sp. KH24]GLC87009.1 hypothetical protein LYSBPC_01360 [Lysinibacillus sp. KH24]
MRKFSFFLILFLLLYGCANNNVNKTSKNTDFEKKITNLEEENNNLKEENNALKEKINNIENITNDQFREAINTSLKFIDAMNNLDYEYLEKNINPKIKINRDKQIFIDENNSESGFLKADYSKLEYRGYHLDNNKILIFFGQANLEANVELEITIKEENNKYTIDAYRN